jgi:hypothetical protein
MLQGSGLLDMQLRFGRCGEDYTKRADSSYTQGRKVIFKSIPTRFWQAIIR